MTAPAGARLWVAGARPRTLPAAVVPVVVGTAAVAGEEFSAWRFLACLIVALALQIATNFANDYSDGVRGTDADRVGPLRLVGSGLVEPAAVKVAVILSFLVAAAAGATLALAVSPWLLVVGAASILAGWFYTGGGNPYGYMGLGEVVVFVFFGLVATIGSAFVQTEAFDGLAVALSVPVGLLATALLVVNNLRDREGDAAVGKRTVAVRLGDAGTRLLYVGTVGVAFAVIAAVAATAEVGAAAGLVGLIPAGPAVRSVRSGADGRSLIAVLEATGRTQLVTGVALAGGLLL